MATDDRPYQARRLRQSTRSTPRTIGRHSSTAMHSRQKVVGHFLGEIPSRKNLKEWIYLFGKIGRLNWIHPAPTLREDGLHMQALPQLRPYTSAVDRADEATRARC